jgi:hypothetical protein
MSALQVLSGIRPVQFRHTYPIVTEDLTLLQAGYFFNQDLISLMIVSI